MSLGSLLEPAPVKWTYIYQPVDGTDATRWHDDEWVPELAAIEGVQRVVVHSSRPAPQPDDVRRSLNAYAGLVEVHLDYVDVITKQLVPRVKALLGEKFSTVRGIVTTVEEEYDLRRHVPAQQHPYATEPIAWKNEPPVAGEPTGDADLWRYVYFFRYGDDVPWTDGEDWYLGHHTREGRQLPGLRRYVTWRRHQLGQLDGVDAELFNGFVRYTELCFDSFEAWHRATHSQGPKWRMDERYPTGVWTDYHQLFIGPEPTIDTGRRDAPA